MSNATNEPKDTFWWRLVNLNPVIWRGIISAIIGILIALGVKFSPDLPDRILVALPFVLALLQGVWSRASVTANAKVAVVVPDPINAPKEIEAGEAVVPYNVSAAEILDAARGAAA